MKIDDILLGSVVVLVAIMVLGLGFVVIGDGIRLLPSRNGIIILSLGVGCLVAIPLAAMVWRDHRKDDRKSCGLS